MFERRNDLITKIKLPNWFLKYVQNNLLIIEKELISKFWEIDINIERKNYKIIQYFNIEMVKLLLKVRNFIIYS